MRAMKKLLLLLAASLMLLLSACESVSHPKVDMMSEFGNAIRWSDWDAAWCCRARNRTASRTSR
jgi:uncharacterized protein YceK